MKEVADVFNIDKISSSINEGNPRRKRTDIDRLEDAGIDSIEKLTEELKRVGNKTSKLSRKNRDAVVNLANKVLKKIKENK
jgi:hypothetical protein